MGGQIAAVATQGPRKAEGSSPPRRSARTKLLVRAEDRGFEPRRVLPPNRISSAPASVPLRSAQCRERPEPQATGTGNLSNLPGRAGFSPGVRACFVRASGSSACPHAEHLPVTGIGPAWR